MQSAIPIQTVHIIFKTHLDIGYTDYARNVTRQYFDHYIPKAMAVAESLRARGGAEKLTWTTGSWLLTEYLKQATPAQAVRVEAAIHAGDLAWHGLPCTLYSELLDRSLFAYGLSLARELDQRFGKPPPTAQTIAAKMTDVPGHTRGIVPLLAAAGIRFLHIGVNGASTPPDVPPVFTWRDAPSDAEVIVMYHKGYGDLALIPGLSDALYFAHTNDNLGPPSAEEVIAHFDHLRARFPGAQVIASTLDAFAQRLLTVKHTLPVVTGEIGNSWIHGVGTDPKKVARLRELARLRREWLASGVEADELGEFSRPLLLAAEHTWGLDEKVWLDDREHYEAGRFRQARQGARWKVFEASWQEQRDYLDQAVAALGDSPRAAQARARLAALEARPPAQDRFQAAELSRGFETEHFKLAFDPHGALIRLQEKAVGQEWASERHPLGLISYETFSQADYDRFYSQYIVNKKQTAFWAREDFTKIGMHKAEAQHHTIRSNNAWLPQLKKLFFRDDPDALRLLLELEFPPEVTEPYGCPQRFTLEYTLPGGNPGIEITLQWFDKAACRLPEAIWFGFQPKPAPGAVIKGQAGWRLDKLATVISPYEAVRNSERHLHCVGEGVTYQTRREALAIHTLDAPLAAPGKPSLLNYTNRLPSAREGLYFNLYNNLWGTNHPMWYDEAARFRFHLLFMPSDRVIPR